MSYTGATRRMRQGCAWNELPDFCSARPIGKQGREETAWCEAEFRHWFFCFFNEIYSLHHGGPGANSLLALIFVIKIIISAHCA